MASDFRNAYMLYSYWGDGVTMCHIRDERRGFCGALLILLLSHSINRMREGTRGTSPHICYIFTCNVRLHAVRISCVVKRGGATLCYRVWKCTR